MYIEHQDLYAYIDIWLHENLWEMKMVQHRTCIEKGKSNGTKQNVTFCICSSVYLQVYASYKSNTSHGTWKLIEKDWDIT